MIYSQHYSPKKDSLIYHYCTADTFHSICTGKCIRLCDIHSMNDFMELHWGYNIWQQVANELIPEMGSEFIDAIDKVIHASGYQSLLVAACFSLNGDVLSQWRSYADDGQGFAIGFKASDLQQLPVRLLKVEYRLSKQIAELKKVIKALYQAESEAEEKFSNGFNTLCGVLAYDLAAFKNPGFSEEQEIRATHVLDFIPSNNSLKIVDNGGVAFGKKQEGQQVKFIMSHNAPKTYIDLNFKNGGLVNPIKEVVIGPRNDVLSSAISFYLETMDIGNVVIKRAEASYR